VSQVQISHAHTMA